MAADSVPQYIRKSRERRVLTQTMPSSARLDSFKAINSEMAKRFGRWLMAQKYAISTQDRYCRVAGKLCHHIGRRPLSSVTPMDIGDYLTLTLPHRWGDGYIADQLGALRCFFDFLYLGGVVDSVAPRFLRARARSKRLPRVLTQFQIKKLIRAATHPRDRALLELLYSTGCRIGEARTLRVEDVDFRGRKARVLESAKSESSTWENKRPRLSACISTGEKRDTFFKTRSSSNRATSPTTRTHGSGIGRTIALDRNAGQSTASGWGIPRWCLTPRLNGDSECF